MIEWCNDSPLRLFAFFLSVAPEKLQMIRSKIKPVEEQIVATMETHGRRLQSHAVHVATVEMPIWKDRMYEAAAPSLRSFRSFLLIVLTVKVPQFLGAQVITAKSTWATLQPILAQSLESSKSRWISFATEDCPRYWNHLCVGIQKTFVANKGHTSTTNDEEMSATSTNESSYQAEIDVD